MRGHGFEVGALKKIKIPLKCMNLTRNPFVSSLLRTPVQAYLIYDSLLASSLSSYQQFVQMNARENSVLKAVCHRYVLWMCTLHKCQGDTAR